MFASLWQWSKFTLKQKHNFLMGAQLVVLGYVIIALWGEVEKKQKEKDEVRVQSAAREAALESKLEFCNQQLFIYTTQNEREYKDLLFETYKIKRKINENNEVH